MECYREAGRIEKAWERRKKDMQWTIASLTYAVHEEKKHEFACSVLPGRFDRPRHFEVCLHVAKESQKVVIERGPDKGLTCWQALEKAVKTHCDLSHPSACSFSTIFVNIYHIFRKVRADHAEFFADLCLMILPVATPLGKCVLLPNGLGTVAVTKLTENAIDALFLEMEESKAVQEAMAAASAQETESKQHEQEQQALAAKEAEDKKNEKDQHGKKGKSTKTDSQAKILKKK
eukprot:1092531-Pyramimonas_sp.AAC.1